MIEAQPERPPSPSLLKHVTERVPADAAALIRALAQHNVVDGFGNYQFTNSELLSSCEQRHEADAPQGIQKDDAVCIASTAGGERYLFLGWVNGATHLFDMDTEAERPEEVFFYWGTLDQGLAKLAADQREVCDDEDDLALINDYAARAKQFKQRG